MKNLHTIGPQLTQEISNKLHAAAFYLGGYSVKYVRKSGVIKIRTLVGRNWTNLKWDAFSWDYIQDEWKRAGCPLIHERIIIE